MSTDNGNLMQADKEELLRLKICRDRNCSIEVKRYQLLGRKTTIRLDKLLQWKDTPTFNGIYYQDHSFSFLI